MDRFKRALGHTDMNAYALSVGMKSADEYVEHLRLHRRLGTGGRITARDIEQAHARDPRIPLAAFNRLADYVNDGKTGRDRADRYSDVVARGIGRPEHELSEVRETARRQAERLAVVEISMPVTERLEERDAHFNRSHGIDAGKRAEAARHAAMTNADAIRRADIEHALHQHDPQPTLYAHDRREILAQGHDRIVQRMRNQRVRDADPQRRPDRGDDRRDDVRLSFDTHALNDLSGDELSIVANPLLETVDNAVTYTESVEHDA